MIHFHNLFVRQAAAALALAVSVAAFAAEKEPVDYVNPYMGNISHLLVPTFPTVQLPNSMLRVYPVRADYTADQLGGLPLIVTHHRERSAFNLAVYQGDVAAIGARPAGYTYDNERLTPYSFYVYLDSACVDVDYAVAPQAAAYRLGLRRKDKPSYIMLSSADGRLAVSGNAVSGWQSLDGRTRVYIHAEFEQAPVRTYVVKGGKAVPGTAAEGRGACLAIGMPGGTEQVRMRYGVSFISAEQAARNMRRDAPSYDLDALKAAGRRAWNEALGRIEVVGGEEKDKEVFYTSMYRYYERQICMSEDGRYYSATDGKIHDDGGRPYYTDDWVWDTYRAAHPLRALLEPGKEADIVNSLVTMAVQGDSLWMPTFPESTGDSRRMNSNHGTAVVADALCKGITAFDVDAAYRACIGGIYYKSLAPWSGTNPGGWLNRFYIKHGYIPSLRPGEKEWLPDVNPGERRQPIAVTLGTAYDEWCLSRIAAYLGLDGDRLKYERRALNYRNVYNPETRFFHPKDSSGRFVRPLDYAFDGGMGARDYYGENNGWVYRWDVPHSIADLISLHGGAEQFNADLDQTFRQPLGRSKFEFYSMLPDHTGNVGQFSMANEPSLHIPYLYNYSGRPWMTQKRVRKLLDEWFRSDLMGLPGDEDGGGMSAFVVFSMMGIYPVTPGLPIYNIGSPVFPLVRIHLDGGRVFEIDARGASRDNKYIQSATLNGREWAKPWLTHDDVARGGRLVLQMGDTANRQWGARPEDAPPSGLDVK
ncbi:MAG TPA: GH92 family glycosyl hydrolase [Candidatus Prevotella stercoripullorum]|nr:GH92 family glycosyl hydrolase [Candidatus Prevotella stercoripullorum]